MSLPVFHLGNLLLAFRPKSTRHTSEYSKRVHIVLIEMRPRDSWNCGWVMQQPLPCQVHSCGHQLLLLPNDLVACFNASNRSFGFGLNFDILSYLYVVLMSKKNCNAPVSLTYSTLQNSSQDLTLITFVLLTISQETFNSFVLQILHQRRFPGFLMLTTFLFTVGNKS